jgi:hypothetical protein
MLCLAEKKSEIMYSHTLAQHWINVGPTILLRWPNIVPRLALNISEQSMTQLHEWTINDTAAWVNNQWHSCMSERNGLWRLYLFNYAPCIVNLENKWGLETYIGPKEKNIYCSKITYYDIPYPYKESYLLFWWLKRTSLALISPNRKIEWTRFYQLSGHAKPFHWSCAHYSPLVSSGESHIGSGYGTSPDYDFPFPIHDLLTGL